MRTARPPAANDDDAYIFIDHREEEGSIVAFVSERFAPADALTARYADEGLFVSFAVKNIASRSQSRGTTATSRYPHRPNFSKTTTASSP